jgi:hypothetical protein
MNFNRFGIYPRSIRGTVQKLKIKIMAKRIVFDDENSNSLEAYINNKGFLYINIGDTGSDLLYHGYIELDKDDAIELVDYLKTLIEQM